MDLCKISIILPVYNVEKYLETCLESLVSQTLEDIEIIAVNDGSTDGSLAVLERFQRAYPRKLFLYSTENHGVSHARNYGFSKARSEYVWFVDSDDFVEKNACEKLYAKACRDGNDLVLFSYYNVDAVTGQRIPFSIASQSQNFRVADRPFEMPAISPYPWIKLIKHELFEGLAFPEGIRFEDLPVAYLLAARARCIGVVHECFYDYRKNAGFLGSLNASTLDVRKAVCYLNEQMHVLGFYEQYREELDFIAIRHFFYRFWKLLTNYETGKKDLKLTLIRELHDHIDAEIPDWRENRYVRYFLPAHLYRMQYLYGSRKELTAFVEACDGMTMEEQKHWLKEYKRRMEPLPAVDAAGALFPADSAQSAYADARRKKTREEQVFLAPSPDASGSAGIGHALSALLSALVSCTDRRLRIVLGVGEKDLPGSVLPAAASGADRIPVAFAMPGSADYGEALARSRFLAADGPLPGYFRKRPGQTFLLLCTENPAAPVYPVPTDDGVRLSLWQRSLLCADLLVFPEASLCRSWLDSAMLTGVCRTPYLLTGRQSADRLPEAGGDVPDSVGFPENVCCALLNMDHTPAPQTPEAPSRPRVLYFTGRRLTGKLVDEFNSLAACFPEKSFWLGYNILQNENAAKALRRLAPGCAALPLAPAPERGVRWKAASLLISRLGLSRFCPRSWILSLGEKEYRRSLGNAAFDEVILTSTDNLKSVAALLHAAPKAVYRFDTFHRETYEHSRPYRHQLRFLLRLLKGAEIQELPEELR